MQAFIVFIVLAMLVLAFGTTFKLNEEIPLTPASISQTLQQAQESLPQVKPVKETKPIVSPQKEKPSKEEPASPTISVNTYITAGPRNGEIIDETNQVTFKFKAEVSPEETKGRIYFETKIEGFDEDWRRTSSQQRTVTLPSGPQEYTFLVRAEINNVVDPTPAKRNFKINVSPYFDKVKISSIKPRNINDPSSFSLITLRAYPQSQEKINITGWKIEGEKGSFVIPQGMEKYNPLQISKEDIFVKRGDTIYLSGASNPLGKNLNFRPNECMGYLAKAHDFPIAISINCPRPDKEEISHLDICCQKYIQEIRTCEILNYEKFNKYNLFEDSQCLSYVTSNFGYSACFRKYSQDSNFLENKWHIYMGTTGTKSDFTSKEYEIYYLRDQNNLLVNKYTYGTICCE